MAGPSTLSVARFFTKPGKKAYDMLKWKKFDSVLTNPMTQEKVFEQLGVEFPENWSLNAINIAGFHFSLH